MKPTYGNRRLLLLLGFALLIPLLIFNFFRFSLTPLAAAAAAQPNIQTTAWQPYTNPAAGYTVDLPPNAEITESDDASLAYKMLFVRLPVASSAEYQGISILVLESEAAPEEYVTQAYTNAEQDVNSAIRPPAPTTINGRAALRLERDLVVGDGDKLTTLIAGDGVLYRVNLFGGGKGGPEEPAPEALTMYERIVRSFQVLAVQRQPQAVRQRTLAAATITVANIFTYPLRSGQGVNYGIPAGLIVADTHVEWLGYGIRNLDQWGVKCYGVDWSRMIHTGEDWYRLDGATTAGTPVYAVADGVVAKHNPGINYPGNVVIIRHRLADGRDLYSMYGHITNVRVIEGQSVTLGQQIGTVLNQGYTGRTPSQHTSIDAHLHFEMRWFLDGTNIYTPGTNGYNYNYPGCTYAYPGRGYTYIIHPDNYPYPGKGYIEPSAFIKAHQGGTSPTPTFTPPPPTPTRTPTPLPQSCEYIRNGTFEEGAPTTSWSASNSQNKTDPLIYRNLPHAGTWGAWFGNVLNYTDTLKQTVALPAARTGATLRFWRYVRSNEAAGSTKDSLQVLLIGANSSEQVIATITSAAPRNQWRLETVPLPLQGATPANITLAFRGLNNNTLVSSFFVDDISLTMPCSAGAQGIAPAVAASVVTTTPEATTVAPRAAEANAACTNLARDGGFESGRLGVGWAAIANTSSKVYADPAIYKVRPRTGSYGAWLGADTINNVWNELVQTVQLPAQVTSVQLRYWRYLVTAETDRANIYDRFTVGIETEKGIQLATPQQIDNTSAGRNTWVQQTFELPNAATYSGQKLWVSFKATTNSSRPSSLYVDDVEIVVCTQ